MQDSPCVHASVEFGSLKVGPQWTGEGFKSNKRGQNQLAYHVQILKTLSKAHPPLSVGGDEGSNHLSNHLVNLLISFTFQNNYEVDLVVHSIPIRTSVKYRIDDYQWCPYFMIHPNGSPGEP